MKIIRTPKSVDIDITSKCNLRCTYCYHFTGAGDVKKDLPKEEWLKFFEELNECNVMNVTLQGGEPFCRNDLKDIISGIVQNRMRFSILSNGTLITDKAAAFLSETHRCNGVQVSIDGSKPEIHDACRGQGSFVKAVEGIRNLQRHHIPVQIRVTINKYNVADLEAIAEFIFEKLQLPVFSTNAASYMGMCRQHYNHIGLDVHGRMEAMETLLRLDKKYNNRIQADAGPLAEALMWQEMENARIQGMKSLPGRGFLTACGCVFSKMAVRADGIIVPCIMLSHLALGRMNRDSLKDIWQHHPEIHKIRDRRNFSLTEFDFCKGCAYINYCTGNCPGLAYTITGEVHHPSPDACLREFLKEGGRIPEVKFHASEKYDQKD
jgi:SynChlorMet cassette radical SAM/SPASM protein ScmE